MLFDQNHFTVQTCEQPKINKFFESLSEVKEGVQFWITDSDEDINSRDQVVSVNRIGEIKILCSNINEFVNSCKQKLNRFSPLGKEHPTTPY